MKRLALSLARPQATDTVDNVLLGVVIVGWCLFCLWAWAQPQWSDGRFTVLMTYVRPGACGYRDDLVIDPLRFPALNVLTDRHGILLCIETTRFFDGIVNP